MSDRSSRYTRRLIVGATLAGLAVGLSGCGGATVNSFDPTDWLDFLDQKKPLPGNRKPVFPEGVPGVEQGVPKELYKENVERQQQSEAAPAPAPVEPEPKAKRGRKPAAAESSGAEEGTAAEPPPKKHVAKRKRITAPPPDETATQPAPAPQAAAPAALPSQQGVAPFPAPLPSGGFSR
ncbi:MAG: hypothetical protein K2W78_07325 [Xanthobacteraceae bacterium]|nr:hypothetical protein [Xanthobacteraceae bacterium]